MKKLLTVCLGVLLTGVLYAQPDSNFNIPLPDTVKAPGGRSFQSVNTSFFYPGEQIQFKLTAGWFTIGKAIMEIHKGYYNINNRGCYKIDIKGWTTGMIDWIAKVDDKWTAYLDRSSLVTHLATRDIKEGNYRKNEITKFDHKNDMIEVTVKNKKTGVFGNAKYYPSANDMRDIIGGFIYLRTIDYSKLSKGDIVHVKGFFEDTFYDMRVKYLGKEKVKTKIGTFKAIKVKPLMPENSLFEGEDAITAWFSDDENKIPLKVEAEMFIGSAGFEVTGVKNLRHKLNYYD